MASAYDSFSSPAQSSDPYAAFSSPAQTDEPKTRSTGDEIKRQLGLTARVGAEVVGALPLAAADFGVGVRNLVTGSKYESPSTMYDRGLDSIFGKRETPLEKGVGIASNVVAGQKLPVPQAAEMAPAAFRTADEVGKTLMAARVQAAQKAGYAVPPATSNPTALNKTLEGAAGKLSTAQLFSARNQANTPRLVAQDLGLSPDAPLTLDAVRAVRSEAAKGYDAVRKAGKLTFDTQFKSDVAKLTRATDSAGKDFPELARNEVGDLVKSLSSKETADAGSTVDAISVLRDKADAAFRGGDGALGRAYKQASTALESLIERNLAAKGEDGASALSAFRDSRKMMAKTYTAEKALNASTGQVSAVKLGQDLAKGRPLEGGMRQAADFARSFPKAARNVNESMPGISPLDFYAAGGVAGLSKEPYALLYPFARQAIRNALATPSGQRLAVPTVGEPGGPGLANALLYGSNALRQ